MATAVHNIEGNQRLSEYDGAGGVSADRADDIVRGAVGSYGAYSYLCSTPTPLNVTTMSLYAGNRVRVVIAWDTDPDYASYANQPSADLDLWVINPSGAIASVSLSWDNTYEIVDFTAGYTGQYTLRVVRVRCDADPKYLGWAWWQGI